MRKSLNSYVKIFRISKEIPSSTPGSQPRHLGRALLQQAPPKKRSVLILGKNQKSDCTQNAVRSVVVLFHTSMNEREGEQLDNRRRLELLERDQGEMYLSLTCISADAYHE